MSSNWFVVEGSDLLQRASFTGNQPTSVVLSMGKAAGDADVSSAGAHWVTDENGNHILIDGKGQVIPPKPRKTHQKKPAHPNAQRFGTARTKADFEAQRKRYVSDDMLKFIGETENGHNPDSSKPYPGIQPKDWKKVASNGALGLYQLTHIALVDIGAKSNAGWDTAFAHAYGITSDRDFLNNHAAQNAAMGQFARRNEARIYDLYDSYGDMTYLDGEGRSITVTQAGLLAAAHKQGTKSVENYFDTYDHGIRTGKVSPAGDSFINVQNRLRWAQNVDNP